MIFSTEAYKNYLIFLKQHRKVISFSAYKASEKALILRHDIDLSVEDAFQVAKLEKEINVSSTFFFLTSSHFYNLSSEINRKKLLWLVDNGFEIGLHFDPTIYNTSDIQTLTNHVNDECLLIESITKQKVKSISLHNPSVHNTFPIFEDYINAYSPEYFSDDSYISDSCMDFRNKDPYEFVEDNKSNIIQVLLHPCHYKKETPEMSDILVKTVTDYRNELDLVMKESRQYQKQMKKPLKDYFV